MTASLLPRLRFKRVREPGPAAYQWRLEIELRKRLYVVSLIVAPYSR